MWCSKTILTYLWPFSILLEFDCSRGVVELAVLVSDTKLVTLKNFAGTLNSSPPCCSKREKVSYFFLTNSLNSNSKLAAWQLGTCSAVLGCANQKGRAGVAG